MKEWMVISFLIFVVVVKIEYHSKGGPLTVTHQSATPELTKACMDAGRELGYSVIDCNGEDQIGDNIILVYRI